MVARMLKQFVDLLPALHARRIDRLLRTTTYLVEGLFADSSRGTTK
jgi:hypothetical protein